VAAKQLGRTGGIGHLPSPSTRSIAALSWPSSSSHVCTTDSNHRYFSDMPLRRPPPKGKKNGHGLDEQRNTKQKWRSHAVSLGFGNYQDDFEYDDVDEYGADTNMSSVSATDSANSVRTSTSSWDEDESELAEQVQEIQREDDERRKRWLKNAKPPIRTSVIDERGRAYGRGGRKTASARVWIQPGFGNVVINRKDFVDYFDRTSDRELILEPLAATETLGRFDITATVEGGGLRGQAGAIRHGLARALNHYNPDAYRPPLKRLGYLTRDPRKVERKKIGHLKARKKPQWVKR
jgi:small subunit ribosomal protein S9